MARTKLSNWLASNGGARPHRGKTAYVARIVGTDQTYTWDREFISERDYSRDSASGKHVGKEVPDSEIAEGDIYEVRHDSWNNERRRAVRVLAVERDEYGRIEAMETEDVPLGPELADEEGWNPEVVAP